MDIHPSKGTRLKEEEQASQNDGSIETQGGRTISSRRLGKVQGSYQSLGSTDFRLFVAQDQIYVSSFRNIVPLWLEVPAVNTKKHRPVLTTDKDAFQVSMRLCLVCGDYCGQKLYVFPRSWFQ
jgi:hypothetical protein